MATTFKCTVGEFVELNDDYILGALQRGVAAYNSFVWSELVKSWTEEIPILKKSLSTLCLQMRECADWVVVMEYAMLRLEKRIDVVLLSPNRIFVLEFKADSSYTQAAKRQTEGYALNLRDFHEGSRCREIVPILCATEATSEDNRLDATKDLVWPVQLASPATLGQVLVALTKIPRTKGALPVAVQLWTESPYRPVPTIIEAATLMYAEHKVADIMRADAEKESLMLTAQSLASVIDEARAGGQHVICFVSGVPGSGKTLVGLNVVHHVTRGDGNEKSGTFLSGNRPLVEVLREALIRDAVDRKAQRVAEATTHVKARIQRVDTFLTHYLEHTSEIPPERVVVFDEAQRAWDAAFGAQKFGREHSEAELLLQIMERHKDWAVIVALVGNGQEIGTGEAGLPEWGRAIEQHALWKIHCSPQVLGNGSAAVYGALFAESSEKLALLRPTEILHLGVARRQFRNETVAAWVNEVLDGRTQEARRVSSEMVDYPILLTRSLDRAREWLKRGRGEKRSGLVASSGARRLRAYGLETIGTDDIEEVTHWFLKPHGDIRSSNMLEIAVREFCCQGLELDFAGVCWGGDLARDDNDWVFHRFGGSKWLNVHDSTIRRLIVNKYRVLLTRAREGMVIWVPVGSGEDTTRPIESLDRTAAYLQECGIASLD